ncbi:MAG: NAD-dependent epimerase/dehydratase family protein [Anaerolineales bacterium]|nr:NAD-dependent epimerase/dehydratase family protein [Anaerolineales bacterium]
MILVTGATGHIGNVLVRTLIERGNRVRAMLLPGEEAAPLKGLQVEQARADVLDFTSILAAFDGVTHAYHLAGMISILPGEHRLLRAVNIVGTRHVLQAARQSGVSKLVYTSSIHALRRVPHGVTIDESLPFDPEGAISAYDGSKAKASLEVLQAARAGLPATIVCPTGVIGPFDFRRSEMADLILGCMAGKPQLYIDGAYDFVDVRDVADGLILACQYGRPGDIYVLGGEQISVRHLLDSVAEITRRRFARIRVPLGLARLAAQVMPMYYRLAKSRPRITPYSLQTLIGNSAISHAKAARELGFAPRPLRSSLEDMIAWLRDNREGVAGASSAR